MDACRAARDHKYGQERKIGAPLVSIERCETRQTFNPAYLPYRQIAFADLTNGIKSLYGARFDLENSEPSILPMVRDGRMTEEDIGDLLLRGASTLRFRDGLFRYGDGDAYSIDNITFGAETVHCAANGPTWVVDAVAVEAVGLLWAVAGVRRTIDEIDKERQIVSYATATRVNLGHDGLEFLSRDLREVVREWTKPGGAGVRMSRRTSVNSFEPDPKATAVVNLEEIEFSFIVQQAAGSEESAFRILVGARHERGSGVFIVVSELPLPEHVTAIEQLASLGQDV
jgi:hypothetical protein